MLTELRVQDFRCVAEAVLRFTADKAVIVGDNGAGKTSILESAYCLGRGRSFRPSRREQLVRHGSSKAVVFGVVATGSSTVKLGISLKRGGSEIRIRGESGCTVSDLAEHLAVQVIEPESHRLVAAGPEERRQFLDFGVFHVEQGFLRVWRSYRRALAQRNAALRARNSDAAIRVWNPELVNYGERLDALRRDYLDKLTNEFDECVGHLLAGERVGWNYRRGWSDGTSFDEALSQSVDGDREAGFTSVGPHRADMQIRFNDRAARHQVSRGQQKLLALALILAQHRVVARQTQASPLLCIDDPAAELDSARLPRFMEIVEDVPGQVLITALRQEDLPETSGTELFHVEHGVVSTGKASAVGLGESIA